MKIRPEAGKLRGVRIMEDPDGILMDPFLDMNGQTKFGYFVVVSEGEPAVFDGLDWHQIHEGDVVDLSSVAATQQESVAKAAAEGKEEYIKILSLLSTSQH